MPASPVSAIPANIPLAASAGTTLAQLSEHEGAVERRVSDLNKATDVDSKERRELLDKLAAQLALIRARIAQMEAARERAEKAREARQHVRPTAADHGTDPANRDAITGLRFQARDPLDTERDPVTALHPHALGAEVALQAVTSGSIGIEGPANTMYFGDLPPGMLLDLAI